MAFVAVLFSGVGCKKDDDTTPSISADSIKKLNEKLITKYLADSGWTELFKKDTNNIYWRITDTNSIDNNMPIPGNYVITKYKGYLLDGVTKFDTSNSLKFRVGSYQVIKGWDFGIRRFKKGQKGILLIPSQMAYGTTGSGKTIPPNTPLRFDIQVLDISND
ncbi:FKBP-type peptidyl-prolyl cis-trans isomerase [Flexibacter flexilis DSM 6793]|uniref:Peptidyl-prolyl cis-trans isomerase n=1 Tax=Flexibacter flexilis DSM 6793 TaxID=927664 RepID=A0A1I1KTD4_9BACT|nr:FKBP-type peptidyl-prolyl cis-trans isomerase [Flexibacter flexilis DSM 6793]